MASLFCMLSLCSMNAMLIFPWSIYLWTEYNVSTKYFLTLLWHYKTIKSKSTECLHFLKIVKYGNKCPSYYFVPRGLPGCVELVAGPGLSVGSFLSWAYQNLEFYIYIVTHTWIFIHIHYPDNSDLFFLIFIIQIIEITWVSHFISFSSWVGQEISDYHLQFTGDNSLRSP